MSDDLRNKCQVEADKLREAFCLKANYLLSDEDDELFIEMVSEAFHAKEKRIAELTERLRSFADFKEALVLSKKNDELEFKLKELEEENEQLHKEIGDNFPHSKCMDLEERIQDLEKEKKHDCEKWVDEGMGCSICSNSHITDKKTVKEYQEHCNWRLASERELSDRLLEQLEIVKKWTRSALYGENSDITVDGNHYGDLGYYDSALQNSRCAAEEALQLYEKARK